MVELFVVGFFVRTPSLEHSLMPLLLTEDELIDLLHIPEISNAASHRNVIENLKRIHDLPCIHICKKPLYPLEAIQQWLLDKVEKEQKKM
jgi:hypothetical protein